MPETDTLWALPAELAETELARLYEAITPRGEMKAFFSNPSTPPSRTLYTVNSGVAIIPVEGVITRVTYYSYWSGKPVSAGQNDIREAYETALADPSVRAILFSVNSPGGVCAGTKELADYIAAHQAKPMAAYVDGLCASAAYWLASATGHIFAPETAQTGSVGVILQLVDRSKANDRMGYKILNVSSGKWKTAGNGDTPISEEELAYLQERVTALHQIFRSDVARHMGISAPAEEWGEAQIHLARPALALGMITGIVRDRAEALTQLLMEAKMTREELQAQAPELLEELRAEAQTAAKQEAQQHATDGIMAVVKTLCGEKKAQEIQELYSAMQGLNLSAEQISGVAALMEAHKPAEAKEPAQAVNDAAAQRAAVLDALHAAHPGTVNTSSPAMSSKNPLLADAMRRAGK